MGPGKRLHAGVVVKYSKTVLKNNIYQRITIDAYQTLLLSNKAWVQDKLALDEFYYFSGLAIDQTPAFLWIGCSDSQVTAERSTGAEPGEMFVLRNVTNMDVPGDLNMLSVAQFTVELLKVNT